MVTDMLPEEKPTISSPEQEFTCLSSWEKKKKLTHINSEGVFMGGEGGAADMPFLAARVYVGFWYRTNRFTETLCYFQDFCPEDGFTKTPGLAEGHFRLAGSGVLNDF